jgi:N-acetylglucosamine kinase-like BadF-type ATPase
MSRVVFIGIDGGGSSTECRLATRDATEIGTGYGGGSNIYATGIEAATRAIREAILEAGIRTDDEIPCLYMGMSGALPGMDNQVFVNIGREVVPQAKKVIVSNDALSALAGALDLRPGICVNAGTGSMGIGKNELGKIAYASGWGPLAGDEGSGYWIGLNGLRAALRAFDQRGPRTKLLETIFSGLGADNPIQALQAVYSNQNQRKIVADLCPLVVQCAEQGDSQAVNLIQDAGLELALIARAVALQLDLFNQSVEVAPVGNALLRNRLLIQAFERSLKEQMPEALMVASHHNPAVGSLLLAFDDAGIRLAKYQSHVSIFEPKKICN